jgi:hypothetical protein
VATEVGSRDERPVDPPEGVAERAVEVAGADGSFIGSGYAVGDDVVLTAQNAGLDNRQLQVRPAGQSQWYDAELVWADGGIGLLRVPGPLWAGVPAQATLVSHAPSSPIPCWVVGIPRETLDGGGPRQFVTTAPGVFTPVPSGPGRVPVKSDAATVVNLSSPWDGLVGAPVLSEDASSILGVIVAERAGFDGRRLDAAPSWQAVAAGLGAYLEVPRESKTTRWSEPAKGTTKQMSPEETESRRSAGRRDDLQRDHVDWQSDAPTTRDMLRRDALARAIATRLREHAAEEPTTFLMLLDGRWGSGKSSVLSMVKRQLSADWLTVEYDAWRQSRLGPSWWTLLAAVRQGVFNITEPRRRRALLRARELWRQRVARTPAILALSLVLGIAVGLFLLLRPDRFDPSSFGSALQSAAAAVTAVGTLWAGALVVSRFLLWQSKRGGRFFEETAENPLEQVTQHLGWLIGQSPKSLLVMIDDLDRCRAEHVVELLESVQTLLRDAPVPVNSKQRATAVMVAADAAWLHRAFDQQYDGFGPAVAEPGKPLGYLFCDKIFQLVVSMPGLGEVGQAEFLTALLTGAVPDSDRRGDDADLREASRLIDASGSEAEVLEVLESVEQPAREQLGPQAVAALTRPDVAQQTAEHTLARFAALLPPNPRSMKRFINDYSMARAVRTLEGDPVPVDALAQWTVLRTRWPALAAHLAERPEAATNPSILPSEHDTAQLIRSTEAQLVLSFPEGTTLTPELIRRCHGGQTATRPASR